MALQETGWQESQGQGACLVLQQEWGTGKGQGPGWERGGPAQQAAAVGRPTEQQGQAGPLLRFLFGAGQDGPGPHGAA